MTPTQDTAVRPYVARRRGGAGLAACLIVCSGLLAACGSDDAEDSFCQAGDDLRSNISGLADLDIVSGGTSALREQVDEIESGIEDIRDSGAEVASSEIDALDEAVDRLGTALSDLGDNISTSGARAAIEAVVDVTGAATDVVDKLATTCD